MEEKLKPRHYPELESVRRPSADDDDAWLRAPLSREGVGVVLEEQARKIYVSRDSHVNLKKKKIKTNFDHGG